MTLFKKLPLGSSIGIIGGGQLGKMLAVAANTMGYKTIILDPSEKACGRIVADEFICGAFDNADALKTLAEKSDVITYEFENIPARSIKLLEDAGAYIPQGFHALAISQDRLREKKSLEKAGFKVAPYKKVDTRENLEQAVEELGLPCILKTRSGGYDGKGQVSIDSLEDIREASKLLEVPCILEKKLKFDKEVSAVCVKSVNGELDILPIGDNVHRNGILHTSIVPCGTEKFEDIEEAARNFFEEYDILGILTIELFLVDGKLVANEIAPRPHNSGHWSLDGANVSQFEQAIRAITGLPLVKSRALENTAMVNLLGQHYEFLEKHMDQLGAFSKIHLYGKDGNVHNRKIGHINITDTNLESLEEKVSLVDKLINNK
ncbi:MAG: 5-(carboxyamino)imidazole ribonucleotide synthase [Gemella sp.]|nr:5-(carboxyamino)imidazole ribonucleotide synthase [Gemella sp.]